MLLSSPAPIVVLLLFRSCSVVVLCLTEQLQNNCSTTAVERNSGCGWLERCSMYGFVG